jgi:hypothetical protein
VIIVRTPLLAAAGALASSLVAWIAYARADLILSHYDAKAHLVVARRVIDNITPGWQQIGAVWLPLPHLIHMLPTQIDALYRTGMFASLVSVACFCVTAYSIARLVTLITRSAIGATVATALLALNPNLLYLHVTPMTEPLLLAVTSLAVLWLYEWAPAQRDRVPVRLGLALAAAAWTRYEAWPVVACAIGAALYASWRTGASRTALMRRAIALAAWPGAAVIVFLINSRIAVGSWFVAEGFFVPDPVYEGHAGRAIAAVWWGTHQLSTRTTELIAIVVAAIFAGRAMLRSAEAALLVPVSLFASAALPLYAFYEGHPFRIRYMVPLVAACALFGGLGVGMLRQYAAMVTAGLLVGITLLQSPPWRSDAPMVLEAQWDRPASQARRAVTACLTSAYRGEKILASMGSLAHYMQELSRERFDIADFVHEGNGVIWNAALDTGPAPHAGWMLVEEQAEGGDVLAQRIRHDPAFARGMKRVCEGGGVALYRRGADGG